MIEELKEKKVGAELGLKYGMWYFYLVLGGIALFQYKNQIQKLYHKDIVTELCDDIISKRYIRK